MPTRIAIVVSHGFQARVLLRTDILKYLRQHADLLIVAPNAEEPQFIAEFGGPNIKLIRLIDQQTSLEKRFESLRKSFSNPRLLATANIKNEHLRRSNLHKYRALRALNIMLGSYPLLRHAWLWLEGQLFSDHKHELVFNEFKPKALITVSPGVFPADARLIRSAKRRGMLTFCVVQSWDNLTSKGYMGARPDKLIVWNNIMKKEAIEYHEYAPENIYIAGVPHFDIYARREHYKSREKVNAELGLDAQKALIFFGTTASVHYPHNIEIIEVLVDAIKEDRFIKPIQLLVRLHPEVVSGGYAEDLKQYDRFRDYVTFDIPNSKSRNMPCDLSIDDTLHLGEMLLYSDVTINTASTLTIDSCCHDRPVVNIGFDGYSEKSYSESAIRFYDYTHYKNIVKTGGIRIAKTKDELIHWINEYLKNPSLDSEGRRRIVEEQCYKLDGHSGLRVAEYILMTINEQKASLKRI